MRIGSWLALAGLVVAVAGCGSGEAEKSGSSTARPPAAPVELSKQRLLGFVYPPGAGAIQLASLDPLTLAPASRPVRLGAGGGITELSPDGSMLAVAAGESTRLELLDLRTMRSLAAVDLGIEGYISRLSWSRSGMLFAAVGESTVAVVDPESAQVVETRQVDGSLVGDIHAIPAGMLALVGPSNDIGPLTAVVFGGKGTFAAPLHRIVGGSRQEEGDDEEDFRVTEKIPGLALDPTGRRALVAPEGGEVAEISLANLRVTYHRLSRPVALLDRLRNWLEPTAEAKLIEGPIRQAVWLKSGLVAVAGVNQTISGRDVITKRVGLSLIDTSDWSVRVINEEVEWVLAAGERLLAFEPYCADDEASYGVVGYDLEGKERFRICRREGFDAQVVGKYAYLGFGNNRRFEVVDLKTGEIVATPTTTKTTSLVTN